MSKSSLKNERKSYSDYLEKTLGQATAKYKSNKAYLNAASLRGRILGKEREGLSSKGMSGSGYEEYLRSMEAKESIDEKNEALSELYRAEAEAYSGYATYLSNYEAIQKIAKDKFISSLVEDGVYDIEEAKRRATGSGLSRDNARDAAKLGVLIARKEAISSAVKHAKEKNYSYRGAKYYALSLGLSANDAERVADAVGRISEEEAKKYESIDKDAYFNLIKENNASE